MTFDLPGGRRLLLRGGAVEGGFWVAAGVAALLLVLWLYREERAVVSRRAGLWLLGLRVLAALSLVTALFEPTATRTYREAVRGRVVLAVDVSESMATADPGRTAEERVKLARTLGLSPGIPPDTLSRREVARLLLEGPLAALGKAHGLTPLAFARDTAPASLATLAALLKSPANPADPARLVTDWLPALTEALAASNDATAPVVGVVLVTDGRRNAADDAGPPGNAAASPADVADRLAARGVPVYSVLVGSTRPPLDAAVAALKAPESVYQGDVAAVEAVLKLDGYVGRSVDVSLERPGAAPLHQTVIAPVDGSRPSVTFRVPLETAGAATLTVAVAPQDGDVRPDNDRRTVTVQVADDKARVLLVDGEARWEFRYVRNALARDPRVETRSVVFRQPALNPGGSGPAPAYEPTLPPRDPAPVGGAPTAPDPLGGFDVIVVGDVDPADAPAEFWARIEAYVSERGGTLVLQPGPKFWAALGASDSARKLLPVLDPRPTPDADRSADPARPALPPGSPFTPTPEALADAAGWPMLQLAADPAASRERWAGLPRLPWTLAGRAKPGATTLATLGGNPEAVVLATQPYGLGKVVYLGTDGTWRWRYRVGDAYHHRFWGQVVRWAASGKLAAGNALVRFGPLKPRGDEGEPVRIQARIGEGVPGVGPDFLLAARVFRAEADTKTDKPVAIVPLRPVPGRPRTFEGSAPGLPVGAYVVRLDAPGANATLGPGFDETSGVPRAEAPLEVASRDGPERVELAADRDPLDRLAAATGGRVVPDYDAGEIPNLLRARTKTNDRTEELPLWEQPLALLLFCALLTAEWVTRKRVGLP